MTDTQAVGRGALVELGLVVAAPTIVLVWLSDPAYLGPVYSLVVALLFPIGHAVYTMATAGKVRGVTVLVLVSVLLTGGIGLFDIDVRWFAWKEAALPLAFSLAAFGSVAIGRPAIRAVLEPALDMDAVNAALAEKEASSDHERSMRLATVAMGGVFLASAVATFGLARWMVTSPGGTEAFATELGTYTGWSFPAIGIPSTVLVVVIAWRVLTGLEARTGLEIDDLLK